MSGLTNTISWYKLKKVITKLTNGKAPGLNAIPPDAFKALNIANLGTLHVFFLAYWQGTADFSKWHKGKLVQIPKNGDLGDPSKWQGVTLMGLVSNILAEYCTQDCLES